jgi:two-component system, OmpR family, sensor histidine kinase KdpD
MAKEAKSWIAPSKLLKRAVWDIVELLPIVVRNDNLWQNQRLRKIRRESKTLKLRLIRILLSLAGIMALTFVAHVFPVNATTIGFAYLLFVLIVASTWGFIEASILSIAATLALNYFFLPPVHTFSIAQASNWVALLAFLTTALIASRLSTKAKQRALDAMEHERDIERLYTFSRAILLIDNSEPFGTQLIRKLVEIFQLHAASFYNRRTGEFYRAGSSNLESIDAQLRETASNGTSHSTIQSDYLLAPVKLGSEPIASLAIQGLRISDSLLQGIVNLVAIGLERARSQDLAQQIEAARQSEQLRTTLIDAMAHEFKTPLTSIKAATTGLLADPQQLKESQIELLNLADEEAEHLKQLIDDTVAMARLDTARIEINPEISDILEIVREVVQSMRTELEGRHLKILHDKQISANAFDRRLVRLAIKQLIDNAVKYSPADTPLEIQVRQGDNTMDVSVTDHGNGIPEKEKSHIFERFFRSPSVRQKIPGSGLGLRIAHGILQAHHGNLTVDSEPGRTTFHLTLPTAYKGEQVERGSNSGD